LCHIQLEAGASNHFIASAAQLRYGRAMPDGQFPATRWSLIARLKHGDEAAAREAIGELCAQYHDPLYCYLRRHGLAHHDAQDALHDFLAKLLRLEAFADAEVERGAAAQFSRHGASRAGVAAARGKFHAAWKAVEEPGAPRKRRRKRGGFPAGSAKRVLAQWLRVPRLRFASLGMTAKVRI